MNSDHRVHLNSRKCTENIENFYNGITMYDLLVVKSDRGGGVKTLIPPDSDGLDRGVLRLGKTCT